jgi:hypothetical protein
VCARNLQTYETFIVSDDNFINSFCAKCFAKLSKKTLPLMDSDTDDPIEILSMKVSRDEKYFAVIAGKNMIKG